jgi:cation:H+ antiporter
VFGLILLLGGGELLVRGAATLARCMGISPLVVGLTIVSFGTSAPELAVNVAAAWRHAGDIAFGNIMGSNMANVGLIVAATALIKPLAVSSRIVVREIPMMIFVTLVAVVFALDYLITGEPGLYDRADGVVLLMLLGVFLYYTVGDAIQDRDHDVATPALDQTTRTSVLLILGGSVALVVGAELTVDGGVGLARAMGISEVLVGLTVVAVGTSLPELAASVMAAYRGHPDIAIGNVVGSNIFNLALVLGVASILSPIPVPEGGLGDLAAVVVLCFVLWATTFAKPPRIVRLEGILLLAIYLIYITWRANLY